jgi:hypothetical protein
MISNTQPILVHHQFSLFDISSWLSLIIRFFTRSYYNHSALQFDLNNKTFVLEARFGGVVVATLSEWLAHRPNKEYVVGDAYVPIDIDNFYNCWGVKYDVKSLLQQAFYIITGKWWGKQDTKRVNCAEVVAWVYKLEKPHLWTPATIEESLYFKFYPKNSK